MNVKRAITIIFASFATTAGLVYLLGCGPKHVMLTPPGPPPDQSGLELCPTLATLPRSADVCTGLSTVDGFQCVRCSVQTSCLFGQAQIYCVPNCGDVRCQRR